jgi:hypothetical protein
VCVCVCVCVCSFVCLLRVCVCVFLFCFFEALRAQGKRKEPLQNTPKSSQTTCNALRTHSDYTRTTQKTTQQQGTTTQYHLTTLRITILRAPGLPQVCGTLAASVGERQQQEFLHQRRGNAHTKHQAHTLLTKYLIALPSCSNQRRFQPGRRPSTPFFCNHPLRGPLNSRTWTKKKHKVSSKQTNTHSSRQQLARGDRTRKHTNHTHKVRHTLTVRYSQLPYTHTHTHTHTPHVYTCVHIRSRGSRVFTLTPAFTHTIHTLSLPKCARTHTHTLTHSHTLTHPHARMHRHTRSLTLTYSTHSFTRTHSIVFDTLPPCETSQHALFLALLARLAPLRDTLYSVLTLACSKTTYRVCHDGGGWCVCVCVCVCTRVLDALLVLKKQKQRAAKQLASEHVAEKTGHSCCVFSPQ